MTADERRIWDTHYRQRYGSRDYPPPDPILFEYVPPVMNRGEPPRALDLACGYAQNALWLARQGYIADAVDISRVALAVAQVRATRLEISNVNLIPADLDSYTIQRDHYDLVVVMRYLNRDLMTAIRAALRPGGRVIYQSPNTEFAGDFAEEERLRIGELLGYFVDWRVLHNKTDGGMSRIVAVKPTG